MYFQSFPLIPYDVNKDNNPILVTHLLRRSNFIDSVKDNTSVYFLYDIKESDRPEIIADKIYGSTEYFWIILLLNDILNPFDWYMSQITLQQYVDKKYNNSSAIHHYEDSKGFDVNSDFVGATPVSNFVYEYRINEKKKTIKLLDPKYLLDIQKELEENLSGGSE
jgi:hypothetical protein